MSDGIKCSPSVASYGTLDASQSEYMSTAYSLLSRRFTRLYRDLPMGLRIHAAAVIKPTHLITRLPSRASTATQRASTVRQPLRRPHSVGSLTTIISTGIRSATLLNQHSLRVRTRMTILRLVRTNVTLLVVTNRAQNVTLRAKVRTRRTVLRHIKVRLNRRTMRHTALHPRPIRFLRRLRRMQR